MSSDLAIQLCANFENSPMLYVPQMYSDFCHKNVIVMERIYGIPVSDVATLEQNGTNMKLLAERGVQVFFTQVFRDSFFHADMHPGNIFVNPQHPEDPQYIGIDCGIVGRMNDHDKRYLAESFVAFFNREVTCVGEGASAPSPARSPGARRRAVADPTAPRAPATHDHEESP